MSDVPWESEGKRNYICIQNIIIDVVSEGLRKVFKNEWNSRYQARFGAWDDTSVSGQQLFNLENTRSRPNKNVYQAKFQHGDTNQWDCSVLFDAILYSNAIGKSSLNPTIQTEVGNIRDTRNKIMHAQETTLSDTNFQTMISDIENAFIALGLPVNDITQMKIKRNHYKSFQVLPTKPTHEVVYRGEKVNEIGQELQTLHINSHGKLTYFYISGIPGSGKSQLSRQLCEDLFKSVNLETETTFVMTLNAKDLDTLFDGYEDFCRRLNCSESILINVMNSCKGKDEKIKALRSLIESRIKNWKRWWIIVDNVENLEDISSLLPQMGDEVWNNGQIILTIQNTTAIPSDSSYTKHISLNRGMNDQECRQLFRLLSRTDANDTLLAEVAEKLDHQPLAMAAAAVYYKKVIDTNFGLQFSWRDYLVKLQSKREITEEQLLKISSAYPSTMSAAVSLAVEKSAESSFILSQTFYLFSLISFEPLPVEIIVQYIKQHDQNCDKEEICLTLKDCSLFLLTEKDVRLHHVVHEATQSSGDCNETETKDHRCKTDFESRVQNVIRALYCFKARDDKIKMIPHLKAFNIAVKKLFPKQNSFYSISLGFEKREIYEIYLLFGQTLEYYSEYKLAVEFHNANFQIWKGLEKHDYEISTFTSLGILYLNMGDFKKALQYHQQALEIRKKHLGLNHVNTGISYINIGVVYHRKGDLGQAKDYYQRALEIEEKQLGPNHVRVANSYNNIGTVCQDRGDLDQAEDYHQQALNIRKKQHGPNHVLVADSYNNLGIVCKNKGDLDQAKDYHQLALQIREKQLGPNHVDVASSYNNIGAVYYSEGDLGQAELYCRRALGIERKQLGPNHFNVAASYTNLSAVCCDKGDLDQAEDYCRRAIEIQEKQLDPNHLDVATSYAIMGSVYHAKGDLNQAIYYYEQALEIQEKQLGPTHVKVVKIRSRLCFLEQKS